MSTRREMSGRIEWRNEEGQLHREDGPAYIDMFSKEWWYKGKLHREDGPAVILRDGRQLWYIDDKFITEVKPGQDEVKTALTQETLDNILTSVNAQANAATMYHLKMVKETTGEILINDVEYCLALSKRVADYAKEISKNPMPSFI
jgi:hypothetical protein